MKARSGTPVNGVGLPDDAKSINPDLSILRKPIPTSITGFRETIQAYENGTDEVFLMLFLMLKSQTFNSLLFNY